MSKSKIYMVTVMSHAEVLSHRAFHASHSVK